MSGLSRVSDPMLYGLKVRMERDYERLEDRKLKKRQFFSLCVLLICFLSACSNKALPEEIPQEDETGSAVTDTAVPNGSSIQEVSSQVPSEDTVEPTEEAEEIKNTSDSMDEALLNERKEDEEMRLQVQIGEHTFTATLEDNVAVDAFVGMMEEAPVVIQMSDYSGFEKVGSLGTSLTSDNSQTTTQAGDIVLYNSSQIVIFYGSNSWSYTRIGKIDDLTGWEDALGSGDVTVTFSIGG